MRLVTWALLAMYALAAVMFVACVNEARAHDDAWWIEIEPSYRISAMTHCCQKFHCAPLTEEEAAGVVRREGGWDLPTGQFFEDDRPYGLYESIDVQSWRCTIGAQWGCFFFARTGG